MIRVGLGHDTHRLESGRRLVIGGVEISHHLGPVAHSDGDVLLHALTDAILGAAGLGDIGEWFPDTDSAYAGADSTELLEQVSAAGRRRWLVGLSMWMRLSLHNAPSCLLINSWIANRGSSSTQPRVRLRQH